MKTKIDPESISDNVIELIGDEWMLVTAGTPQKFNTMTASWGGMGELWHKPVVFVFIRPSRYTFGFVEDAERFSLTFFDRKYKDALSLLGSKSGRDCDKIALSGLTPAFTPDGTPVFEQARLSLECRKLFATTLQESDFIDRELLEKVYPKRDLHKLYIAEIVNAWKESSRQNHNAPKNAAR